MKYLRFGKIPNNEKSINFLKLSFVENEIFTKNCQSIGYEKAVSLLPDYAFEKGVSVFELDEHNLPVFDNIKLIRSFLKRLNTNEECFVVSGSEVGKGVDGEPLIIDVKKLSAYFFKTDKIFEIICSFFEKNGFKKMQNNSESFELFDFFNERKQNVKTGEIVNRYATIDNPSDWKVLKPIYEYSFYKYRFESEVDFFDN